MSESKAVPLEEFAAIVRKKLSYVRSLRDVGRLVLSSDGKLVLVDESIRAMERQLETGEAYMPAEVNQRGFAFLTNKKPSYITHLKATGRLVLSDCGKLIKVAESIQRIADTMDPSKFAVTARHAANRAAVQPVAALPAPDAAQSDSEPPAIDLGTNPRYQESKALREEYLAKSARRDYELSMGKLLPADEVLAVVSSAMSGLRSRFEQLPDILGPQLAALTDEAQVRSLMADTIEHALEDAARQFAQISKTTKGE